MKKLAIFITLLIISFMNITMKTSNDSPEMISTDIFSDGCTHEVSQPNSTDNPTPAAGGWNGTLNFEFTTQFDCIYNNGSIREFISSNQEQKDNTWSEKMTIAIPLQVHLEGSMSTGEDGSGTIVASFAGGEDLPNGKPSSFGCPPIISIKNCTLTLNR